MSFIESETLEFKKSTAQLERALKAVCGFLNHKGGIIYFGINNHGEIEGQDVSDTRGCPTIAFATKNFASFWI